MADAAGTIICAACGFENGGRTQYCQDCGAKLDRPETEAVFAPAPAAAPPAGLTPPRVPSPTAEIPVSAPAAPSPRPRPAPRHRRIRVPVLSIFGAILRTLFYAAVVAFLIQVMRRPADLPPRMQPFPPETVQRVRVQMQEKASTGGDIHAPWGSLNSYLAAVLAPGDESGQHVSFSRAALAPAENGSFALYADRKIFGLNFYTAVYYKPVSRGNGGLGLVATGAAVGRVRLPAWMAGLVETSLGGLDTALYSELEILRTARSVQIGEKEALLHFAVPQP